MALHGLSGLDQHLPILMRRYNISVADILYIMSTDMSQISYIPSDKEVEALMSQLPWPLSIKHSKDFGTEE